MRRSSINYEKLWECNMNLYNLNCNLSARGLYIARSMIPYLCIVRRDFSHIWQCVALLNFCQSSCEKSAMDTLAENIDSTLNALNFFGESCDAIVTAMKPIHTQRVIVWTGCIPNRRRPRMRSFLQRLLKLNHLSSSLGNLIAQSFSTIYYVNIQLCARSKIASEKKA